MFGRHPGQANDSIGYVPQHYADSSGEAEAIRAADVVLLGLTGCRWAFGCSTAAQMPLNADRNRCACQIDVKRFIARSRCRVGW